MTHNAWTPNVTDWRWHYDDGSETAANFAVAANTILRGTRSAKFTLRVLIAEVGGDTSGSDSFRLEFAIDGGAYNALTTSSTGVRAYDSSNLTDAGVTTQRLGSGTFVAGEVCEDGTTGSRGINASEETEIVWTCEFVGSELEGDTTWPTFRVARNDGGSWTTVASSGNGFNGGTLYTWGNDGILTNYSFEQDEFRFYDDDAGLNAATALDTENTNISRAQDTNTRLRVKARSGTGTNAQFNVPLRYRLRYSKNSGAYTVVDGSSTNIRASASSNFNENTDATTERLTAGAGTFRAGTGDESDGICGNDTLENVNLSAASAADKNELEWCFQVRSADTAGNDTFDFQFQISSDKGLIWEDADTYTSTGRLTVSAAVTRTITTSLSGLAQSLNETETVTLSGMAQVPNQTETVTLSGMAQEVDQELTVTLSGMIKKLDELRTAILSGMVQEQDLTQTVTLDARVAMVETIDTTLNSLVQSLDETVTTALNGLAKVSGETISATLNAEVVLGGATTKTISTTLNSLIQSLDELVTLSLNGLVQSTDEVVTTQLSGMAQEQNLTITTALSAYAAVLDQTISATLNAILQATITRTVTLNAVIGQLDETGIRTATMELFTGTPNVKLFDPGWPFGVRRH